jgi:hypothetical protein
MKKTIIAALASLMLAGAISAVSGAPTSTATGTVVIVGDGASPIPIPPPANSAGDDRINHSD